MSDSTSVSEALCDERMKRLEERVDKIETIQQEIHTLSISVERLAMTVKNMVETQKDQDSRIDSLENKDAKMWQDVVRTAITGFVGIIIGYALKQIGVF
jgi:TolA-binding protein